MSSEPAPVEVVPIGTTDDERFRNKLFGAGIIRDPYPTFHRMQSECPVHAAPLADTFPEAPDLRVMSPDTGVSMATCTHDAAVAVLRDAVSFPNEPFYAHLNRSIGQSLLGMDEPGHRRLRVLVQAAFSKPHMDRWRHDIIEPIVDEYIDALAPRGSCDLQEELGSRVPVHTISAALNLPADERATFFDLAVRMSNLLLPVEEQQRAAAALGDYVAPLVAERRAHLSDDLIGTLVAARVPTDESVDGIDDRPLTDEEIATFVRVLVVAGSATTYRAYGTLLFHLLTRPALLEEVRADPTLWPGAVEEAIRIDQPLATIGRIAVAHTEIEGIAVPEGARVEISLSAANHDPLVWDDPEEFDVRRERVDRHLSFGFGIHRCLGIHLARAELEVMLEKTLTRLPELRLDPDGGDVFMSGLGIRVVNQLPVVFRPS